MPPGGPASKAFQSLRVRGPLACFTRPELKVERFSYPVLTPSAARAIVEAVLWKPAIRWTILRIKVLAPIAYIAFRRNEVNSRAASPSAALIRGGGQPPVLFADDDRSQRNTVALRDVDYVIEARFELTDKAEPDETHGKFAEMFRRRVEKGQHHAMPYLGCREFPADVLPADGAPEPIAETREIGPMLWDLEYGVEVGVDAKEKPLFGNRAVFFRGRLERGVLTVPASADAARQSLIANAE